ncbi:MAG: ATP-binding protein [Verrucomicrobiales bacterium]
MPAENDMSGAGRLAERREFVRRSVLRANRAIGAILVVVLLLGGVLAMMIKRAQESQRRAEKSEAAETEKVWKASLAQARAENLSTKAGHREAALEAIRTAGKIRPSIELRNEAIAALALYDLVPEQQWPLESSAYGVSFDQNLEHYVTRYDPTVLSMYRMKDNTHVRDFPMPSEYPDGANVGDFQFSRTGKYLLIRYNGGGLTQWDPRTGELLRTINADPRAVKTSWPLSFSADDRLMGLSMDGSAGSQFVYDLALGEVRPLPRFPEKLGYRGFWNTVRISPQGDVLAGFAGSTLYLFDAVSGEQRGTVEGPATIQALTWDRQGQRLAFSCGDQTLFTWEPSTGSTAQMGGSILNPWVQDFTQDGTQLMTSGSDGVTRLWDVASSRLICEIKGVLAGWMSADGRRFGGGVPGQSVGVWRVEQPAANEQLQASWVSRATVWRMDLSQDGRYAVWTPRSYSPGPGYELCDLKRGKSALVPMAEYVEAGFRPGYRQIWTIGKHKLQLRSLPADGELDPVAIESNVETIALPEGIVGSSASFSADGRYALITGAGQKLVVLDLERPDQVVTLEAVTLARGSAPSPVSPTGGGAVAISPDGSRVVAGMVADGESRPVVWDARSGEIIARLDSGPGITTYSPDGRFLAIVGLNRVLCFSTANWQVLWERRRDSLLAYQGAVSFTGDSSLIACSMGTTRIEFIAQSGESVAEWDFGNLHFVSNVRLAADGSRLIVGGLEGRVASVDLFTLRQRLKALNLDWPLPREDKPAAMRPAEPGAAWMPALLGILPVAIAVALGALVLRRQTLLTHEFVEATEIASQRERELAAEREVSELKSRFVTTVSHEFRTPLGITMSAVELLRHYEERLPPNERKQLFDDIYSATRNMAELMEQVLVLGRVDAGKLAYKPVPLDIDAFVAKLCDESLSATSHKCPIEWTAENDLSGAAADEALLRHIFTNLLSNAVKYSPAGSPVRFGGRREGRYAVFSVVDSGIGIPEHEIDQLFEAFHRGSNVGEIPGTGLGLVISKRCAELHGGTIGVVSRSGEGTEFVVRLPAWS